MKLSTRGEYAVRALLVLALEEPAGGLPLRTLAERSGVPRKYLEQILMLLRTEGILGARRGQHGGYFFSRSAEVVTVGEVVRAMDGPLAPALCASTTAHAPCPPFRCPSEESCVMRGLWLEVRDAIADILDGTSFGELASRERAQRPPAPASYQI